MTAVRCRLITYPVFGGGDDSIEIYPSVYLSWHWCGALRWGSEHLEKSSRPRAACLVRGGVWRDVLLGNFCAGTLEAPIITRGANQLPPTAPRDS